MRLETMSLFILLMSVEPTSLTVCFDSLAVKLKPHSVQRSYFPSVQIAVPEHESFGFVDLPFLKSKGFQCAPVDIAAPFPMVITSFVILVFMVVIVIVFPAMRLSVQLECHNGYGQTQQCF